MICCVIFCSSVDNVVFDKGYSWSYDKNMLELYISHVNVDPSPLFLPLT